MTLSFVLLDPRLTLFPSTVSVTPLPCPNHTSRSCFAWKTSRCGGYVCDVSSRRSPVTWIHVGVSNPIVAVIRVADGGPGSPFDAGGVCTGADGEAATWVGAGAADDGRARRYAPHA